MAFDLKACYGFGEGANLIDFEVAADKELDNFNSYARINSISANLIDIDIENAYIGQFGKFKAGETILIHASSSPSLKTAKLGKFICAKIEVADGAKLTLDKDISTTFTAADLNDYNIQAVTFAQFHSLKIFGTLTVQNYSSTAFHGGILALKVADVLRLEGVIDLTDKGISPYQKDYLRPLLDQELLGELDNSELAGGENYCNNNIFPVNAGDGAAFIFAKNISSTAEARIGNPSTHGKNNCRAAQDTKFKPSNVTNVGGSSILLVCKNENISSTNLAKYRTTFESDAKRGKGLARCYIATNEEIKFAPNINAMRDKNQLYHADIISDYARLSRIHNLHDFGKGILGSVENPRIRLNTVLNIKMITARNAIMTKKHSVGWAYYKYQGTKVVILSPLPQVNEIKSFSFGTFEFKDKLPDDNDEYMILTVPEFENLTMTENYDLDDALAMLVQKKCKITGTIQSQMTFIFAKELEVADGAWLGESAVICAEKITGDLSKCVGDEGLHFIL